MSGWVSEWSLSLSLSLSLSPSLSLSLSLSLPCVLCVVCVCCVCLCVVLAPPPRPPPCFHTHTHTAALVALLRLSRRCPPNRGLSEEMRTTRERRGRKIDKRGNPAMSLQTLPGYLFLTSLFFLLLLLPQGTRRFASSRVMRGTSRPTSATPKEPRLAPTHCVAD